MVHLVPFFDETALLNLHFKVVRCVAGIAL